MKCNKCNHALPNDSEFCQYCGSKIEECSISDEVISKPSAAEESVIDDIDFGDPLKAIFEVQVRETVKAMEANSKNQPNHEDDADFGLVPEKPIYTFAMKSVAGEEEYLNSLYTLNGEKIKWNRRGSTGVAGINGLIDVYNTYLPSGQPYKTIYINMYGAKPSTKAPCGFVLATPKAAKHQGYNNSSIPRKRPLTKTKEFSKKNKLVFFFNIVSIVLSSIAMLSIIVAMNVQDAMRNELENLNTTAVYFVLLAIFGTFLGFAIDSLKKHRIKLAAYLSPLLVVTVIAALAEWSVFSEYDVSCGYYHNWELVNCFNSVWVASAILIFIIALLPVCVSIFEKISDKWHASVGYREKCYNRIAKMHDYLEKGIITEEEFKKAKSDILKYVK